MTAKEYLEQPGRLKEEIQSDVDNLASLRSVVEKVTTSLSFTAGRGGKDPRSFENTMINIKAEEEKIWEKTEKLKLLMKEVMCLINQLPYGNKRRLLKMRYIEEKTWREIAAALEVGERYVYDLHRQALKDVEKRLQNRI